jgi:hypothetical protein
MKIILFPVIRKSIGKIISLFAVVLAPVFKMHSDFLKLFLKREGLELLGRSYRSFWVLLAIMSVTFIAIGFSNGSLKYLENKMSDPFINWVNVELPRGDRELAHKLITVLDNEKSRAEFKFSSMNGYYKFDLFFKDEKQNGRYRSMGRTIDFDSPLLDVIFSKKNLIAGRRFNSEEDLGLIVTENFLKQFNYTLNSPYANMHFSSENNYVITYVPLPIIAIVRELPDMSAFATTPYFYNQRYLDSKGNNPFSPKHTKDLVIYINDESFSKNKFDESVKKAIASITECKYRDPSVSIKDRQDSYLTGKEIRISFFPTFDSVEQVKNVFDKLLKNMKNTDSELIQLFDYQTSFADTYRDYDYLAVNFKSLDKVRSFKNYLFNELEVEIDMAQIESKENFNFVTKLTRFISLILLAFCILSITMFLSNLLKSHLYKIRMNIGTFKAFGMGNRTLKLIYLSIVGIFISFSLSFSIFIAFIFGELGGIRLLLKLLSIELEAGQKYFHLADLWTLIAIISILLVSLSAIYLNSNKLFEDSPGNLINNRE